MTLKTSLIIGLSNVHQRLHLLADLVQRLLLHGTSLYKLSAHEALVRQLFSRGFDGLGAGLRLINRKVVAKRRSIVESDAEKVNEW